MKRNVSSAQREPGSLSVKSAARLINKRDPVILEIGANVGQTTAEFLKEMPDAKIFCFEPDPRAIAEFTKNIDSPNVKLVQCAVGDKNGSIVFHQSSGVDEFADWNQSGSIRAPKDHTIIWPKVLFEKSIEVSIIRLDDWIRDQQIDEIDFIWADVQGAEEDLILGGLNTINKSRFFYTEYGFQEIYEGQISIAKIDSYLQNFSLMRLFAMDALFENLNMRSYDPSVQMRRNEACYCGSGRRYKHCHGRVI